MKRVKFVFAKHLGKYIGKMCDVNERSWWCDNITTEDEENEKNLLFNENKEKLQRKLRKGNEILIPFVSKLRQTRW